MQIRSQQKFLKVFPAKLKVLKDFNQIKGFLKRSFTEDVLIVILFCMPVKHLQAIIMLKTASENSK